MRKRNKIFAEAFKWIKAHRDNEGKGVKYQKDLAAIIGVSEDTITRIMRDQTEVTDDFLCKFNEAFDNVFNYQWLRGEDDEPMLAAELGKSNPHPSAPMIDNGSAINAALAAQMQTIESLKSEKATILEVHAREIKAKDDLIQSLRDQLAAKDQLIAEQKAHLIDYRRIIDSHNGIFDYPFPIGAAEGKKQPNI